MEPINKVIYTDGGRRLKKSDNFLGVGAATYGYSYPTNLEGFSSKWPKVDAIFTPYGITCKDAVKLYSKDGKDGLADPYRLDDEPTEKDIAKWRDTVFARAKARGKDSGFTPIEKMGKTAEFIIPYLASKESKVLSKVAGKASSDIEVTEVLIPLEQEETGNVAELTAMVSALKQAKGTSRTYIYADSEYVIKGINEYMPNWKLRNWLRGDGTPPKNLDYWKTIDELTTELKDEGVEVILSHIYSHRGNFGNEAVDDLATLALMMSANGSRDEIKRTYSLRDVDAVNPPRAIPKHLGLKWIYSYTNSVGMTAKINDVYNYGYLTGDHVRKSSAPPRLVGKPQPDSIYGLIYQREELPIVGELSDECYRRVYRHSNNEMESFDFYNLINAGNVNRGPALKAMSYGLDSLKFNYSDHVLENLNGDPMVVTMHKPMLSRRLATITSNLQTLLAGGLDLHGHSSELTGSGDKMTVMDITDMFTDGKKMLPLNQPALELEVHDVPLRLAIGIDVPPRGVLIDQVGNNLKVSLCTYGVTDKLYKYFCYVECDEFYGVFLNPYSNTRLLIKE